ncbi:MAG: hypothetical protein NXI00_13285 [Cytophagales bacterium]|nr:hypothetical protein [Cytophagales bacterium]
MKTIPTKIILFGLLFFGISCTPKLTTSIFFSENRPKALLKTFIENKSEVETIHEGKGNNLPSFKSDLKGENLYYIDHRAIFKYNLKNKDKELVITYYNSKPNKDPYDFVLDEKNDLIYVTYGYSGKSQIGTYRMNGDSIEVLVQLPNNIGNLVLDNKNEKLYWFANDEVTKCSKLMSLDLLNPTQPKVILGCEEKIWKAHHATLDEKRNQLYWAQNDTGVVNDRIRKVNLTTRKITDFVWNTISTVNSKDTQISYPLSIAFDSKTRFIYWSDVNKHWIAKKKNSGGEIIPVHILENGYPAAIEIISIKAN